MEDGNRAFNTKLCIGLTNNELEFEVPSRPFLLQKLFKFMGSSKTKFEIVKSVFPEFIIKNKYYLTYVSFGRSKFC